MTSKDEAMLRQAQRDLQEARPKANGGPVNSLLVERAYNIGIVALDRLRAVLHERDKARAVARLAVAAWHWYQESGQPPGCGCDEREIRQLYAEHPWLADKETPGKE